MPSVTLKIVLTVKSLFFVAGTDENSLFFPSYSMFLMQLLQLTLVTAEFFFPLLLFIHPHQTASTVLKLFFGGFFSFLCGGINI